MRCSSSCWAGDTLKTLNLHLEMGIQQVWMQGVLLLWCATLPCVRQQVVCVCVCSRVLWKWSDSPPMIKLWNPECARPSETIVLVTWSISCRCRYFLIATNIFYQVLLSETHILLPAVAAVCSCIAVHPALAQQHFTVMLWCRWRIWVWSWQSDSH